MRWAAQAFYTMLSLAPLVILLLSVFYSSIIILFGVELTGAYAQLRGRGPRPDEHAEQVQAAPRLREQT